MLSVAKSILQRTTPLSAYDHNPALQLAVISATERCLLAPQHIKRFDTIARFFLMHHKVSLPYRLPIKVLLLGLEQKSRLTSIVQGVIDRQFAWPSHLRTYPKSRVQLIGAQISTILGSLLRNPLQTLPTRALEEDTSCPCTCHAWSHRPNVHMWEGHIVFRDPTVLTAFSPKLDPAVF